MAEYYINPAATGNDDGSTKTDAWTTLQRAIDGTVGTKPGAGDVVLATGTENVTAVTDSDGNAGDLTSGVVTFRGVNSSWVNDGTRYGMNAVGNSIDILRLSANYIKFENFELYNTSKTSSDDGIVINGYESLSGNVLVNCIVRDVYKGINGGNSSVADLAIIKTKIYDTTSGAIIFGSATNLFLSLCNIYNIGGRGLFVNFGSGCKIIHETIIRDCTSEGIKIGSSGVCVLLNAVLHNNGDGIESEVTITYIIGGRITSNTVGIDSDDIANLIGVYMPDTGEDLANTTKTTGLVDEIVLDGTNTNNLSGTDTDGGYEDSSTNDYNLTDTASLRRVAIDLDG